MPIKPQITSQDDALDLEAELSKLLPKSKVVNLKDLAKKYQLKQGKLKEIISKHYYLAPENIRQAMLYLFLFTTVSTLAVTAIRYGTETFLVSYALVIGLILGVPFLILWFLFRKSLTTSSFRTLAYFAAIYLSVLFIIFIILILFLDLNAAILIIPVILIYAYLKELSKLNRYFSEYGVAA